MNNHNFNKVVNSALSLSNLTLYLTVLHLFLEFQAKFNLVNNDTVAC